MSLKNIQIATILVALFLTCVFVAFQMVVHLPYIVNWPYTGFLYGSCFVSLAIVFVWRVDMPTQVDLKMNNLFKAGALLTLLSSGFLSFTVRFLTEAEISSAFESGTIVEKYKSDNHSYLSFRVKSTETGVIALEGYSQDLWDRLRVGDKVSKHFGKHDLTPLTTPRRSCSEFD